jgi:serine/threonine protein kinase
MESSSKEKLLPSTKSSEEFPHDKQLRYKTVKDYILDMSLQVGKGHFGEVYQAVKLSTTSEKIERRFACKVISHCKDSEESEFMKEYKRFVNEVAILSQL